VLDERFLTTPIPANTLPGARGVVELGDVVTVTEERQLPDLPPQRPRCRDGDGGTGGGLRGAALRDAGRLGPIEAMDWPEGTKPESSLHGQPEDEGKVTLLWDGEWEVTFVTFRDMGAAFGWRSWASTSWSWRSSGRSSCRW
jgi:hypothetical protein